MGCESNVTLNGREYVAVDSLCQQGDNADLGVRVVVLQRGWVVVGHARRFGPRVVVSKCAVVRRWGTTTGLGQLASGGPIKDKTVLDETPDVECLESEIVLSMKCEVAKWGDRV
jgi:hypothetical protein